MNQDAAWTYFLELHQGNPQEGPGDFASTERAYRRVAPPLTKPRILDVGCGPGRQTLDLLRLTDGTVTALDRERSYLRDLEKRAADAGVGARLTTVQGDMASLPFPDGSFDLIWAEGSIYCMGFEKGLQAWKPLLGSPGSLAISELTRLRADAPQEAVAFWEGEYPAMKDIPGNLAAIAEAGYRSRGHFILPVTAWQAYYEPLARKHDTFRQKHRGNSVALEVLAQEGREMEMYRKYSDFYGYVFYVAEIGGLPDA